jgi:radical SAM family uncharacterized protein
MNNKTPQILTELVNGEFLSFVRRPARYIGGEVNQVKKDLSACELRIALCFPDIYEVGMSHTGMAIIYNILNSLDGVAAERCFSPWTDAEKILRDKKIPLFSLESKAALNSFDCIGFSLTNELCCTNVLNILDLSGISLRSKDRTETDPLIIGGGGQANCCEPAADFFDLFVIGEGENAVVELAKVLVEEKRKGTNKKTVLRRIAESFDWAYVPQFYALNQIGGKINGLNPLLPGLRTKFNNAVVEDFDNAPVPLSPIVPFVQAVQERVTVEIMRGCPGRCRFCQASFCRRPVRFRSIDKIVDIAKACYKATGFDTVSLLSLSSGDYPNLDILVEKLQNYFSEKHVGLSLPSLRVREQLKLLPAMVTNVRKGAITIAVEAGSERLRRIINKPLKDDDLFAAVEQVWQAGWGHIKLYFMAGLPGETEEDVKRIVELCLIMANLHRKVDGAPGQINAAVSWFVPKPHTPFGWLEQKPKQYFEDTKQIIFSEKKRLRARTVQFKFHYIDQSILESAIGRGDRRLADVIESAFRSGARFDLWDDCFDVEKWRQAFAKFGLDLETFAQRKFEQDETLPWQHLGGPDKEYLLSHLNEALKEISPPSVD